MDISKPQSNGPLCNNMVIGTLAVDGWGKEGLWWSVGCRLWLGGQCVVDHNPDLSQ